MSSWKLNVSIINASSVLYKNSPDAKSGLCDGSENMATLFSARYFHTNKAVWALSLSGWDIQKLAINRQTLTIFYPNLSNTPMYKESITVLYVGQTRSLNVIVTILTQIAANVPKARSEVTTISLKVYKTNGLRYHQRRYLTWRTTKA